LGASAALFDATFSVDAVEDAAKALRIDVERKVEEAHLAVAQKAEELRLAVLAQAEADDVAAAEAEERLALCVQAEAALRTALQAEKDARLADVPCDGHATLLAEAAFKALAKVRGGNSYAAAAVQKALEAARLSADDVAQKMTLKAHAKELGDLSALVAPSLAGISESVARAKADQVDHDADFLAAKAIAQAELGAAQDALDYCFRVQPLDIAAHAAAVRGARALISAAQAAQRALDATLRVGAKAARIKRAQESRDREAKVLRQLAEDEEIARLRAQEFYDALEGKHLHKTGEYDALIAAWSASQPTSTPPDRAPLDIHGLSLESPDDIDDAQMLYARGWSRGAIAVLAKSRRAPKARLRFLAEKREPLDTDDADALELYARGWTAQAVKTLMAIRLKLQAAGSAPALNDLAKLHSELAPAAEARVYDYALEVPYSLLTCDEAPAGVDPSHRELHLPEADFAAKFQCSKAEFSAEPLWRQAAAKKKLSLF